MSSNNDQILPNEVKIKLEKPFEDERGGIQPLVDLTMKSCVLISSKKGSIRANHYHKTDWHFCYVLEGEIDYYHRKVGDKEAPKLEKIKKDELFFTPPMVEHAMYFPINTEFIALAKLTRKSKNYEKDTVRINLI